MKWQIPHIIIHENPNEMHLCISEWWLIGSQIPSEIPTGWHSLKIVMHSKLNDGPARMAATVQRALQHAHAKLCWSPDGRGEKKTFRGVKRQSWPDVAYWPSTQLVEKKQMLRVSRGLSCVNSGERVWGSDSPVRDELSTFTVMGRRREERGERGWERRGNRHRRAWRGETDRVEMKAAALISNKCSDVTLVMSKQSSGLAEFQHVCVKVLKLKTLITVALLCWQKI